MRTVCSLSYIPTRLPPQKAAKGEREEEATECKLEICWGLGATYLEVHGQL